MHIPNSTSTKKTARNKKLPKNQSVVRFSPTMNNHKNSFFTPARLAYWARPRILPKSLWSSALVTNVLIFYGHSANITCDVGLLLRYTVFVNSGVSRSLNFHEYSRCLDTCEFFCCFYRHTRTCITICQFARLFHCRDYWHMSFQRIIHCSLLTFQVFFQTCNNIFVF